MVANIYKIRSPSIEAVKGAGSVLAVAAGMQNQYNPDPLVALDKCLARIIEGESKAPLLEAFCRLTNCANTNPFQIADIIRAELKKIYSSPFGTTEWDGGDLKTAELTYIYSRPKPKETDRTRVIIPEIVE